MKHILVLVMVLFGTAAKADWTPGTVLLGKFQQELYSDPREQAGVYAHLKNQLSALIGWSKQAENKARP